MGDFKPASTQMLQNMDGTGCQVLLAGPHRELGCRPCASNSTLEGTADDLFSRYTAHLAEPGPGAPGGHWMEE